MPLRLKNAATDRPTESASLHANLTPLESTLASQYVGVDSKALTGSLKPLESTLTKKHGEGMQ